MKKLKSLKYMLAIFNSQFVCTWSNGENTIAIQIGKKMASKGQHVVPNGGKWSVRKSGSSKVTGTFRTQKEAIAAGKKIAKNQRSELYIHREDGRIRERNSYGNDPKNRKG